MRWLIYIGVAVSVFVVFLLVSAPASFVLDSLVEKVNEQQSEVAIGGLDGSVWNGSGNLQYLSLPVIRLNWQVAALPLLGGTADATFHASAEGLTATAETRVSQSTGEISNLDAVVESRFINTLTRRLGLDLTGEFTLEDGSAAFNQRWLTAADGQIRWPGGRVTVQTPADTIIADLPPLQGSFSLSDETLVLDVVSGETAMMELRLQPTGWVAVAINSAFLETAGINLSSGTYSTSTDPAILLEEKLF